MSLTNSKMLKDLSFYNTGGACIELFQPENPEQAAKAVSKIGTSGKPFFILGGGSNSLVWDDFFDGYVINLAKMRRLEIEDKTKIYCEAGISNTEFSEFAYQHSLSNAGWMNRLPGQLGGTIRMNARCYGGEISQIVTEVSCVTSKGELVVRSDPAMFRGYKDTIFMENGDLILGAKISLEKSDQEPIRKIMDHCESDRASKDQFTYPSCGCVFKNSYDIGIPSGMLLDHSGAKQLENGGAVVSSKHSNFVFNKSATSQEILELTFMMRECVWKEFGVWLEYEMEILGELPSDFSKKFLEKRDPQPILEKLQKLKSIFNKNKA